MSSDKFNDEKRVLLNDLINLVKEVTSKYSGERQLVTDRDPEVEKLLICLENTILFGLKNSFLDNLQELFTNSNGSAFWNFAYQLLTKDEQKRFSSYKNLWTDKGRTKALIRNALNEHCLERYLLTWVNADNLNEFYEPHAILRDEKSIAILPKLAIDLSHILFAIPIDIPELNVTNKNQPIAKTEPIIAVPNVNCDSIRTIKPSVNRRNIEQFEETAKSSEASSTTATLPALTATTKYEPSIDYSVNVPNFCETISICADMDDAIKDDDTTSLSSNSSSEENEVANNTPKEDTTDQNNEYIIMVQRERIQELENKVHDLTSEITRLRDLLANSTQKSLGSLANFQIAIPRAVLNKTKTKNFYIYEINLRSKDDNDRWTIFKRYRDFYNFHKQLKKRYLQIRVLDFPPKKKIGNLDFDFVEERRQRLQVYIRHVLQNVPELASCSSKQALEAKCQFFKT